MKKTWLSIIFVGSEVELREFGVSRSRRPGDWMGRELAYVAFGPGSVVEIVSM